ILRALLAGGDPFLVRLPQRVGAGPAAVGEHRDVLQRIGLDRVRLAGLEDAREIAIGRHTNCSPWPAMTTRPSSSSLRQSLSRFCCAFSTSLRRTGPRESMSSLSISAARDDMFLKNFSRTSVPAPLSA